LFNLGLRTDDVLPGGLRSHGSGFVVSPNGIIVTNKHVVDDAVSITVIFENGGRMAGRLLATEAIVDLAALKVDVAHPLPVLKWADSNSLRLGNRVLAIGNPLGLGMSVSGRLISALNRDIQDTPFDHYIQTDAAINHGNSGGPLVDINGDVVGVNTAFYNPKEEAGFIGIGFAIPAESAAFTISRLLDPRHPKLGWLGVKLQDLNPEISLALGATGTGGAIVAAIDEGGPAKVAGLGPSDILLGH
jgi:serine protease Do